MIANLSHTFQYEGIGYYVPAGNTASAAAGESLYDADAAPFFGGGPVPEPADGLAAAAIGTVFDDGRTPLSTALPAATPSVRSMAGDLASGFTGQDPNSVWH